MKRLRFYFILFLFVLVIWLLICTHIAGVLPIKELLERISIPVIVFMTSAALFTMFGRKARVVLFILLCAFSLFESAVGILQMLKLFTPNNPYHILTGNFLNQGLYGGLMALTCVACIYEFIKAKCKGIKITVGIVFVIDFIMLAISVSRAAWIGLIVATLFIIYIETNFKINFNRRVNVILTIVAVLAIGVSIFVIKPESAMARVHIWRIDFRTIVENPLFGSGSGTEAGAYGDAQEHFFVQKQRAERVQMIADNPQFAYNEFLKFGMQGGFPGLLLSIAVFALAIVLLYRKRSEYLYLLITFGVFSLFSFPLDSLSLASILSLCLADAMVEKGCGRLFWTITAIVVVAGMTPFAISKVHMLCLRKEWRFEPDATRHYGKYYPELRYDAEFISHYGELLYKSGNYQQAAEILLEGVPFTSGSLYHCILGSCQELMGEFTEAEKSFKKAMNMVPSRLTPYYLLINHYNNIGFIPIAAAYRDKALSIPYDPEQSETVRIRKLIEEISFVY